MVHSDASSLPSSVTSKTELYAVACEQLDSLIEPGDHWLSVLSNAASLLYHLLNDYGSLVNWSGFYLDARVLGKQEQKLLLGPFQGKTACQYVLLTGQRIGVCAAAFNSRQTQLVPDVHARPGHIFCDPATKCEVVVPLGEYGVLDLDSAKLKGFDEEDVKGLERFVQLILSRTSFAAL